MSTDHHARRAPRREPEAVIDAVDRRGGAPRRGRGRGRAPAVRRSRRPTTRSPPPLAELRSRPRRHRRRAERRARARPRAPRASSPSPTRGCSATRHSRPRWGALDPRRDASRRLPRTPRPWSSRARAARDRRRPRRHPSRRTRHGAACARLRGCRPFGAHRPGRAALRTPDAAPHHRLGRRSRRPRQVVRTRAVDGVDLRVATGSVYGVLGRTAPARRPRSRCSRRSRDPTLARLASSVTTSFASRRSFASSSASRGSSPRSTRCCQATRISCCSRACRAWAGRRPGARPPSSSRSSGWGMPRRSPSPSTPAACDAASTSRPASSPSRR